MSNDYQPASFGGRATEGAWRDRSSFQNPDLRGDARKGDPRTRAALWALALGVLIGGGVFLRSVDWETFVRGEGYVPWRLTEKHAVGDCRRFGKHLVLLTLDPASPLNERFERDVLSNPEVQKLSAGLIWFKRDMTPGEVRAAREQAGDATLPTPPRVEIVTWSLDEVLAGPADAGVITPAAFAELMREALVISATPSEVTAPR